MRKKLRWSCDIIEVGYLALPYLLFFVCWFKYFIGIPMAVLIIGCIIKESKRNKQQLNLHWTILDLVTMIGLLGWIYFSGVGGFAFENGDWQKHNAIISDLVNQSWPVVYKSENRTYLLIYYLGFYLPATAIGKAFNHSIYIANLCLFCWTVMGVLLLYREIKIIFKNKAWLAFVLFVFFSGMDILGYYMMFPQISEELQECPHLEVWTFMKHRAMLQYSSNTTQLFWVPQHAIAGWIASMLIFRYQNKLNQIIFIWCLTIFFSPFVFVGLSPFMVYLIIKNTLHGNIKKCFSIETITGLIIALLCGLYYISNTNETESMSVSFIWNLIEIKQSITIYLLFVAIEFLLLAIVIIFMLRHEKYDKKLREWFGIAIGILLVLPLMKYGFYNDLCMRASIPALIIFWLITAHVFLNKLSYNRIKLIIGMILLIGAVTPIAEISRSLQCNDNRGNMNLKSILEMPSVYQEQYVDYNAQQNRFYIKLMRTWDKE